MKKVGVEETQKNNQNKKSMAKGSLEMSIHFYCVTNIRKYSEFF